MKTIIRLLFSTALIFACSCTNKFEEISEEQKISEQKKIEGEDEPIKSGGG